MRVSYDKENDILALSTGQIQRDGASLYDYADVAVLFGTDGGRDIVGVEMMAASHWFSKGYNKEKDTWLLGDSTDNPDMITVDGDFVGYWQPYEADPRDVPDPIGVAVRRASIHMAEVSKKMSAKKRVNAG